MVINDLRKFIFIHIPKNAGNSVTRLLLKHSDNSSYDDVPQHAALKWVGINFPEKLLYKKICFSRNPFSRMVSWWTYYRSNEKFWKDYDLARHAKDMEFNEWLLKCIQRGRQELVPQVYFISPMYKFEGIGTIDLHPLKYNNYIRVKFNLGETENPSPIYLPNVDFVGKVENLEQDIKRLFGYLDVATWSKNNVMDITKENPSKEKVDYREHYNTESVEIVQSIFQQDFEYFNYSYDLAPSSNG